MAGPDKNNVSSAETDSLPFTHEIPLKDLKARRETSFLLTPEATDCSAIAAALGLLSLKKLRFEGVITPAGRKDWTLRATLGATVEQPCVVTLAPVRTRIEEKVTRSFLADFEIPEEGSETEIDSDENIELLKESIDVGQILTESLALALPLYPRVADAGDDTGAQAAPPGVAPLQDEDTHPFAALGALRDKFPDAE